MENEIITLEQKLAIYKEALGLYINKETNLQRCGLCATLRYAIIEIKFYDNTLVIENNLPYDEKNMARYFNEIYIFKPKKVNIDSAHWFPINHQNGFDVNIRIDILNKAIENVLLQMEMRDFVSINL